jgi:hypothetical protein
MASPFELKNMDTTALFTPPILGIALFTPPILGIALFTPPILGIALFTPPIFMRSPFELKNMDTDINIKFLQ